MGKDTHYTINEYKIVDGQNVEIKAHVHARFGGIFRSVDFTGTVPLEHLMLYALKQAKLTLATKIMQQAGVIGPEATWKRDAREKYERLWVIAQKHGVDFRNPESSDPAGKLRSALEDLRRVQATQDVDLQSAIERLEGRIRMLEG